MFERLDEIAIVTMVAALVYSIIPVFSVNIVNFLGVVIRIVGAAAISTHSWTVLGLELVG